MADVNVGVYFRVGVQSLFHTNVFEGGRDGPSAVHC